MSRSVIVDPWKNPIGFVWSELRVGLPLNLGIAAFLAVVFGGGFWVNLVYSLCIGLTIQFSIEIGRYTMVAWLRRHRPGLLQLDGAWPGWPLMAPWVVLCAAGGFWAGSSVADALTGNAFTHANLKSGGSALAVVMVVTLTISAAATWFFYARGRMAVIEAQAEAARRTAIENELMLLQSQLEPHMLFNTLANLRVLIGLDPARAQEMLDHLIAFLRATLNASRVSSHPLTAEFDRIRDYLSLMAVRMGPRLSVNMDLPQPLVALSVPPLLLQPLVENGIKHGLEPKVEGGRIEVRAWRDGGNLHLSVRDTGIGLQPGAAASPTGFGTAQVRERLAALFGPAASLTLSAAADAEGGTVAEIILPLHASST